MSSSTKFLQLGGTLTPKQNKALTMVSFLMPLFLWAVISYMPAIWHPQVKLSDPGDSIYFSEGDSISIEAFKLENKNLVENGDLLMRGERVNPAYFPAPHQVVKALYSSFTVPPKREGEPWFHESVLQSVKIVFWSFFLSSLIGVPLGILCGVFSPITKLIEPFVEFFRYFPAPVFGALAVAVLGINDAPKVAIIVIGTLFQQILVLSNTTRGMDFSLVEAAQTLGASRKTVLFRVIIPSILPKLYLDMRILLGWAWTYLIVAEVVGTSSGISWFINQQAKYRAFDNVYAAILVLGFIGLGCDMILAAFGTSFFAWEEGKQGFLKRLINRKQQLPAQV